MDRLRAVLVALALGAPLAAGAADVTRVASSFEDSDVFDMFIDVGFERTQFRSKILREVLPDATGNPAREYRPELWYQAWDARVNIDVGIGLYQDLELRFGMPVVLQRNENWSFVLGQTSSSSTVANNCLNPDGTPATPCQPLFPIAEGRPFETFRGGLGNLRLGLVYALFNQQKDDTKPMWLVGIDYEGPTAALLDPSVLTSPENRGNIGDRVHKYTFSTALSRRIGLVDPYFKAQVTLPVRGPGAYDNCSQVYDGTNPNPALGTPGNCGQDPWKRKETGIQPPMSATITAGTELNIAEDAKEGSRLVLDVRGVGTWMGPGRYYNELSGALRKLLYTEDYFQMGGTASVTWQSGETIRLRATASYLYTTDHALTDEFIGKDVPPPGADKGNGEVNLIANPIERNPNFDYRTDFVSRRFYASENRTLRLEVSATFAF